MLDWFETKGEICVVTEYGQGELFEILEDDHTLPEATVRIIAQQLGKFLISDIYFFVFFFVFFFLFFFVFFFSFLFVCHILNM
jgi:hypothetical protein